jgi:hypothetical protein
MKQYTMDEIVLLMNDIEYKIAQIDMHGLGDSDSNRERFYLCQEYEQYKEMYEEMSVRNIENTEWDEEQPNFVDKIKEICAESGDRIRKELFAKNLPLIYMRGDEIVREWKDGTIEVIALVIRNDMDASGEPKLD